MKVSKITVRNFVGKIKTFLKDKEQGDKIEVFCVFGVARSTKVCESPLGSWVTFKGVFEAHNQTLKKIEESFVCVLPEPLQSRLALAIGVYGEVQFGANVHIIINNHSLNGFDYLVDVWYAPEPYNKLTALRHFFCRKSACDS